MEDIDYGALFGISEGENGQETAAPAADPVQAQGEKETETAEPSEHQEQENHDPAPASDSGAAGGEGETGSEAPGAEQPKGQTAEQNAQFAAARRKAERDAAVERARQEEQAKFQKEMNAFFADANLKNTITGAPITNMEEFNAWKTAFEAAKLQRELKAGKLTPEGLNKVISENPIVKKVEQLIQRSEDAARQAREQQAKLKADEQVKEISKLDPSIQSLQDLTKMENYPAFYELVKQGKNLLEAFKLANFDALTRKAAAASRQAAMNAAQSKQHLSQTTARGAGAVSVPADVMEQYRTFNPDATDAEIQAHYSRNHKK